MPLFEFSGAQAVEQRKGNPFATWGNRSQKNRVEPITKPGFSVPFQLNPDDKIFTVGSCFARHVEHVLKQRGFQLPMLDLFNQPEFADMNKGIVNNFGTPSIYNEFAWALGEQDFVAEDHIVETQNNKYIDMHVISSIRPTDFDTVLKRREAITAAYRSFMACRVVIITLGLVEVWYDSKTGFYLNSSPRPTMLRNEPDRFKLHVLSFDEVYSYLEKTVDLIQKHGQENVQIIITISPVPLAATHRTDDVIVANSYSKSVLRAAAETVIARRKDVTYYPSFESVSLSDRKLTWVNDFVHVTDEIVSVNINRMVDAYVESEWTLEDHKNAIETGGVLMAVERAAQVRQGSQEDATAFFEAFGEFSKTSLDFALEHVQYLQSLKDYAGVLRVVEAAPEDPHNRLGLIHAEALIKLDKAEEAFDLLTEQSKSDKNPWQLWHFYLESAKALNDEDKVFEVLNRWIEASPSGAGRANGMVARWFYEKRDYDRALELFDIGISIDPEDALIRMYRTEALLAKMDHKGAQEELARIVPRMPNEKILLGRLKERMQS